jgi:hypothetical protein
MRVTTNDKLIGNRRRLGTYATLGGLGILVVGMLASIRPQASQSIWISLGALAIGFLLAQLGNYNLRRYGRSPRPDEVVETALKGLDDRHHFYAWSLPAPYVLLSPQGVYSFVTRDQSGKVSVTGSQWHTKFSLSRLLMFAQEGLGNPTRDALDNADKLGKWIAQEVSGLDIQVVPAIIFIDERTQLTATDPTVPVLDPKGLKKWLRGPGKGPNLKSADYRRIQALFDAKAAGVEHTDAATPEQPQPPQAPK